MRRHFLRLLALSTFLPGIAYADTDGEVHEEVEAVIASATDEVSKNLGAFIQANEKPLATARTELNRLLMRLNEERRFDLAKAVQRRLETLTDTVQKRAIARVPVVMPASPVGKWTWPDDGTSVKDPWIQLNADGTASASWHNDKGLWTIGADGRVRMLVTKSRSVLDASMSPDGKVMTRADGKVFQRVP